LPEASSMLVFICREKIITTDLVGGKIFESIKDILIRSTARCEEIRFYGIFPDLKDGTVRILASLDSNKFLSKALQCYITETYLVSLSFCRLTKNPLFEAIYHFTARHALYDISLIIGECTQKASKDREIECHPSHQALEKSEESQIKVRY
jgi:hypothetical protein